MAFGSGALFLAASLSCQAEEIAEFRAVSPIRR
jgi:hypothetical protein